MLYTEPIFVHSFGLHGVSSGLLLPSGEATGEMCKKWFMVGATTWSVLYPPCLVCLEPCPRSFEVYANAPGGTE